MELDLRSGRSNRVTLALHLLAKTSETIITPNTILRRIKRK
jgi:hypothetical protein